MRKMHIVLVVVALLAVACGAGGGGSAAGPGSPTPDEATAAPGPATEPDSGATTEPTEAPAELTPVTFQLNWTWYASDHAYFEVGLQQGFYAEEGLDVTIREGNGSGTTAKLIGTGDVPLGYVDAGTMINGIAEGLPIKAIGVVNQVSPMAAIFKAEKGFETFEDLRGARIAGTQGDALSQILPAVLAANGMSMSDIAFVSTANPPAKEVAVLNDNADALLGYYNEQAPRLEATQGVEMDYVRFSDAGANTLNMALVANADWLADNADVARAFVRATQRAIEYTVEHPEEAAEIFAARHDQFSPELALAQITESFTLLHTPATEDLPYLVTAEEDWRATQQILVEYAGLETDADVSSYYTNEFAQ